MNDPHLIGFSLSFCLRDILAGRVKEADVLSIVTGCSPRNQEDVKDILDQYCRNYWSKYLRMEVDHLFARLEGDHRIMWCADWSKNAVNIGWSMSGQCGPWLSTRNRWTPDAQLQHDDAARSVGNVIQWLDTTTDEGGRSGIIVQAQTVLKYLKGDQT